MTASNKQTTVHVTYHHEDGSWWAESEQLPGLFAGGDSLEDAKGLARQVVSDEFGDEVTLAEWMPVPDALEKFLASPGEDAISCGGEPGPETLKSWPDSEDPAQFVEPDLQIA
jgi:predicted RNase H-like HicB family nuclease